MGEWPLAGRNSELQQLRAHLTGHTAPGVVLAGHAGVGKTRLASECLRLAEHADMVALRVTATRAATGLPLGPFAALLPPPPSASVGGTVDDRADLLRRCAASLLQRADGRHLALLVDDAHLLDDLSATLVHQLAVVPDVFMLVTVRTGELAPDPVVALWKDHGLERIELGALGTDAIEAVLTSALGGTIDRAAVALLAVHCRGNILFLRELVLGALEDGTLREDSGIWHLIGPLSPSGRLIELVEARLGEPKPNDRRILELVAFGEPMGPGELGALADAEVVGELERRGLLSSRRNGRRLEVSLANPTYGDVLRARIPGLQARGIVQSLAEAIESLGARRREDGLRVATWRLDVGGGDPGLMLAAATTARWRYDFSLAERLVRVAIEAGAGFEAHLLEAQLASRQGRDLEADGKLAMLATAAIDDSQRGLVAIARLDHSVAQGRTDEALQIAADAEETITDPAWRDQVAIRPAFLVFRTQGPRAAAVVAEPLLERAEGAALVMACLQIAQAFTRLGRLHEAEAAAVRAQDVHSTVTQPLEWYPWIHLLPRCDALDHAGRFEESWRLASEQYGLALEEHSSEAQAFFAMQLSKSAGERGHALAAVRYGREAVATFRQLGRPQYVQFCLSHLALALALTGEIEEARQALLDFDALGQLPFFWWGVDFLQGRAWTAAASGDLPRARHILQEAADLANGMGDLVGEAAALHCQARLGDAKTVVERLAQLAGQIDGELAAARADHVRALVDGDAERLEQLSTRFEDLGALLLAAEAASEAAVAWRQSGQSRRVTAAERRAASLASRCPGVSTPALQAVESRAQLTRAERESALLAAKGRSDKEIAQELTLSVRTVENHLYRVYAELGLSGRVELAAAFEQTFERTTPSA